MKKTTLTLSIALAFCKAASCAESFPPLVSGKVPQTPQELWSGYDPSTEPLEAEVVREWK